jgi:hypothetical protein
MHRRAGRTARFGGGLGEGREQGSVLGFLGTGSGRRTRWYFHSETFDETGLEGESC